MPEPPPRQVIVRVPQPVALPGQLRPRPDREPTEPKPPLKTPDAVVDEANRRATSVPDTEAFINAITTYDYVPGGLFTVFAAPLRVTSLELEPGEHLLQRGGGPIALGDPLRWKVGTAVSGDGQKAQQHVLVKPLRSGLITTALITTDRRSYYLELKSYESTAMVAVQWRYADSELDQMTAILSKEETAARSTVSTAINVDGLDFNYAVKVKHGRPEWVPTQVFDDGHKTFLRFPPSMLEREAPVLFVLSAEKDAQLVQYRVRGTWYVVDGLFAEAELRSGLKDPDVVRVVRGRR